MPLAFSPAEFDKTPARCGAARFAHQSVDDYLTMKIRVQQAVRSPLFSVGIILLVLLAARAFRVWSLGVYWDDWRILARGVEKGAFEIFRYMAGERILMGVSHALLFALFGPHPLAWHLTNLLLEFGIAVLIYLLLRRLLPDNSLLPVLAACLFVAYPLSVIRMHMINVYINVATLLAGLSLYLTSLPLGHDSSPIGSFKHRIATFAAAALIPIYLLSYELPVGFEVVQSLYSVDDPVAPCRSVCTAQRASLQAHQDLPALCVRFGSFCALPRNCVSPTSQGTRG